MSAEAAALDTPSWVTEILDDYEATGYFDESDIAWRISAVAKNLESPSESETEADDNESD